MKKVVKMKTLILMLGLFFAFVACEEGIDREKVKAEMDDVQYELETTAQNIDREIDNLEAELDTAGAETSMAIRTQIANLENLKMKTSNNLDELSKTTAEEWKEFKTEVDSFTTNLRNDLAEAIKDEDAQM